MAESPHDFDAFCHREYSRLVGALSFHVGDAVLGEDIAQEALVRAFERWDQVRELRNPGAWTYRVAVNLANSWFRRKGAERRALVRHGAQEQVHDPDAGTALAVRMAVARLPTAQRNVVVLRFFYGYSVSEAAEQLRMSEGAVTQHTRRAVRALRSRFQPVPDRGETQ